VTNSGFLLRGFLFGLLLSCRQTYAPQSLAAHRPHESVRLAFIFRLSPHLASSCFSRHVDPWAIQSFCTIGSVMQVLDGTLCSTIPWPSLIETYLFGPYPSVSAEPSSFREVQHRKRMETYLRMGLGHLIRPTNVLDRLRCLRPARLVASLVALWCTLPRPAHHNDEAMCTGSVQCALVTPLLASFGIRERAGASRDGSRSKPPSEKDAASPGLHSLRGCSRVGAV
jgi:hypothetical protein